MVYRWTDKAYEQGRTFYLLDLPVNYQNIYCSINKEFEVSMKIKYIYNFCGELTGYDCAWHE